MQPSRIKVKLFEKGITYKEASKRIGISLAAFTNKINSRSCFTVEEAICISKMLELSDEETIDIFFK